MSTDQTDVTKSHVLTVASGIRASIGLPANIGHPAHIDVENLWNAEHDHPRLVLHYAGEEERDYDHGTEIYLTPQDALYLANRLERSANLALENDERVRPLRDDE